MSILPTAKTPPKPDLADLTVLWYGQTKIGKSSTCAQTEGALFLATEPGLNALDVYQAPILNAYKFCVEFILRKFKVEHESDLGYGKGYALVNNEFQRVLTKLAFLPYGLFLISHAKEMEMDSRTGKYTRVVPTLPDKARKIVLGMADMVLFCDLEVSTGENGEQCVRRVIRTKPSLYYEAGDRTGRLPETLDLDFKTFLTEFSDTSAPVKPASSKPAATAAK
jgi:hypothetical protein